MPVALHAPRFMRCARPTQEARRHAVQHTQMGGLNTQRWAPPLVPPLMALTLRPAGQERTGGHVLHCFVPEGCRCVVSCVLWCLVPPRPATRTD
jgi:hypothetical protein